MENKRLNIWTASHSGRPSPTNLAAPMQSSQLMKLFEDELKSIYWAEKAITRANPKMIRNATSKELIEALENHLAETNEQVKRVEQIFEILGKKTSTRKCDSMESLIKEVERIMEISEAGAMCDAGIISMVQKIEHYEIAAYATLRQFAEALGLDDVAGLLQTSLDEEKEASEILLEIATNATNVETAQEEAELESRW